MTAWASIRRVAARSWGTLRPRQLDREFDAESGAHLAMLEERFRAEGVSAEGARYRARREFGNLAQLREAHRAERAFAWVESWPQELGYVFRSLGRKPGFSLTAIISIALAVGASSAIFSYADGLLLRPLPVPDPSGVVSLRSLRPGMSSAILLGADSMSYPDFEDFRNRMTSLEDAVAFDDIGVGFAVSPRAQARFLDGYMVSGNFFDALEVEPILGRGFLPEEDEVPGRNPVLVLGNGIWASEFGAETSVVGRSVRINGLEFTIIGVAPESFTGIESFITPDFFIPVAMGPAVFQAMNVVASERLLTDRKLRTFRVKGRLAAGVSGEAAAREASLIAAALADTYPDSNRGWGATVNSEVQLRLVRFPMLGLLVSALFTVVVVNLLVACANVANLMLTRGQTRARELAVRLALGAGRARIVRLLLTESLVIAAAAGLIALLVADLAIGILSTIELDDALTLSFRMDRRVVLFTALASLASAILFGLVPALGATRRDVISAIKAGESGNMGRRFTGRTWLAVGQIAGSVTLLVGAAGFQVLFDDAVSTNPGFATEDRITMRLYPSLGGYDSAQTTGFYQDLVDRSLGIPGVRSAALASTLPLTWFDIDIIDGVVAEGYEFPADQEGINVFSAVVDEHYFDTLEVPLIAGRGFTPTDTSGSRPVAVVNEEFALEFLGPDPIGRRLRLADGRRVEVVGVTSTVKRLSVIEPPIQQIYLPFDQNFRQRMALIVETEDDPAAMVAPLRDMIRSEDADVAVFRVRTMEEIVNGNSVNMLRVVGRTYFAASLMGLMLALIGLYAVLSFQVARRTREIGIRMALGAQREAVVRMFMGHAAVIAVMGVVIGISFSVVGGWAVDSGLGGIAFDPRPLVLVTLGMLATSVVAAMIPARRASCIDPQEALRHD